MWRRNRRRRRGRTATPIDHIGRHAHQIPDGIAYVLCGDWITWTELHRRAWSHAGTIASVLRPGAETPEECLVAVPRQAAAVHSSA